MSNNVPHLAGRSSGANWRYPEDIRCSMLCKEEDIQCVWVHHQGLGVIVPVGVGHLDRLDVVYVNLNVIQQHHWLWKLVDSEIGPSRGEKSS